MGPDHVDKYIDVIAPAIWAGSPPTISPISIAYAPPFSPVFAPAQVIGELARKECGSSSKMIVMKCEFHFNRHKHAASSRVH